MMRQQAGHGTPWGRTQRLLGALLSAAALLVAGLCLPPGVHADEGAGPGAVPEDAAPVEDEAARVAAQAAHTEAKRLVSKGDAASLAKAFAALDAHKDAALDSIEYWALYARAWLALKKDANELWNVVFVERQEAEPRSVVFHLARARVETDNDAKEEAIDAALKRDPKSVPARVAKGELLIAQAEEDEGAEILEALLEEDEHCLGALLAMGRLDLSDGMPEDALEYCTAALEKHGTAEVHHLMALCYQRMGLTRYEAFKDALSSATAAMGLDPTTERIELFNELLKKTGDSATAAKELKVHFERTKHPLLAALLADSAFKAGDYEGAILGLSAGDQSDLVTIKALATCYARLGRVGEAQAAATRLIAVDSQAPLFVARLNLSLGEADAATKHLGSLADSEARRLRALAHAWRGEAEAVQKLVTKQVATGTREGEALLIAWLQASVLKAMDADLADAVRNKLLEARFQAGRNVVAQAAPHQIKLGKSVTAGWPRRALTWFRAPCGAFYRSIGEGLGRHWTMGEKTTVGQSVSGEAECGGEKSTCTFVFNETESKSRDDWFRELTEETKLGEFEPAEKFFATGCAAYAAGRLDAATSAFQKALVAEPNWSRIKVLRSVMQALEPGGERRAEAREAKAAVELWTDDFELRRLVIYLRAWAGDAELKDEIQALAEREAQYNVRNLAAL